MTLSIEVLPGKHVNGRHTLGENIADLAGLTVAYDAYRRSLGRQALSPRGRARQDLVS